MSRTKPLSLAPVGRKAEPGYPYRAMDRVTKCIAPIALSMSLWLGACGPSLPAPVVENPSSTSADFISTPWPERPPDHGLTPAEVRRNEAAWSASAAIARPTPVISLTRREHRARLAGAIIPVGHRELVSSIQESQRAIIRCFEDALHHDPELGGRITVELELGQGGRLNATITDDEMGHEGLGRCLIDVLSGLPVPRDDIEPGTRWRYPFIFAGPQRTSSEESGSDV